MLTQLNNDLSDEGAIVESFQLLEVGVTADFNDVRSRQQAAAQEVQRAQADLQVAQINALSRVTAAQQEAQLIISQAQINAQQNRLQTNAMVQALSARYAAERVSYSALKTALNMTTEELLALIWLDAQTDGQAGTKVTMLSNLPKAN
jgi:regulator of protease activity HflC (stomatin/prohibitin superfamily)